MCHHESTTVAETFRVVERLQLPTSSATNHPPNTPIDYTYLIKKMKLPLYVPAERYPS